MNKTLISQSIVRSELVRLSGVPDIDIDFLIMPDRIRIDIPKKGRWFKMNVDNWDCLSWSLNEFSAKILPCAVHWVKEQ